MSPEVFQNSLTPEELRARRMLRHFKLESFVPLCGDKHCTLTTLELKDVDCPKCLEIVTSDIRNAAYYKALEEEVNKKNPTLRFYLTPEAVSAGIKPPSRAYTDDAGYDLRLLASEPLLIPPHERRPVPTGVGFEIPSGWYGLICNRTSGGKRGLVPLAQVVDASYTGVLTLTLHNTNDSETLSLEPGERVAQIVFMPTWAGSLSQIEPSEIKTTDRGSGAYGSSGKH